MISTKRWLVVKLADIGDLITITPALSWLRKAQPGATIHLLTTGHSAPIVPDDLVDEIILFDKFAFDRATDLLRPENLRHGLVLAKNLRQTSYDGVLLLHHLTTRFGAIKYASLVLTAKSRRRIGLNNGRGWFLTEHVEDCGFGHVNEAEYWLRVVQLALREAETTHHPVQSPLHTQRSESDMAWAADVISQDTSLPIVVIHPGSGGFSLARRWEPEHFAVVADQLHEQHGAQIIIVGGPDDNANDVIATMTHSPLDLTGQTNLGQLGAIIQQSDLFIGADSGVLHLAASTGIPIMAIFGPSNAEAWGPWTEHVHFVRSAPACSPCSYIMGTVGQRDGCPARTCMKMVTPDNVIDTANHILEGSLPSTPPAKLKALKTDRVRILGVPLNAITWDDLHDHMATWIGAGNKRQICTVNPEFIMAAQEDIHFYTLLNRVDLCAADGQGLLWAAKHIGSPLPDRITGSDGVPLIAKWAAKAGWRLFLLGAAEGVAEKAAQKLREQNPGIQIVGTYSGSPAPEEEDALVDMINKTDANILFVAYGAPRQDKWIARNLPRLNVNVAMGVGGSLDFIVGVQKRAPQSWQRFGLEWLYRLIQEPWRWRRMIRLPRFVLAVLRRGQKGPVRFTGPLDQQQHL